MENALTDDDVSIRFMKFETQQDVAANGTTRSPDTFTTAQSPFKDFVDKQIKGVCLSESFLRHRFVSRWQNHAFSTMQEILPIDTAVIVFDFSMNWAGKGAMDPSQSFFNPFQ